MDKIVKLIQTVYQMIRNVIPHAKPKEEMMVEVVEVY